MRTDTQRQKAREYYARIRKKYQAYQKQYRKTHPLIKVAMRQAEHKYRASHRVEEMARTNNYRKLHPKKIKILQHKSSKKWYVKPKNKAKKHKYYLGHIDEIKERAKKKYLAKKIRKQEKNKEVL